MCFRIKKYSIVLKRKSLTRSSTHRLYNNLEIYRRINGTNTVHTYAHNLEGLHSYIHSPVFKKNLFCWFNHNWGFLLHAEPAEVKSRWQWSIEEEKCSLLQLMICQLCYCVGSSLAFIGFSNAGIAAGGVGKRRPINTQLSVCNSRGFMDRITNGQSKVLG